MVKPNYSFNTCGFRLEKQFESFRREFLIFQDHELSREALCTQGFQASFEGYDVGPIKIVIGSSDAYRLLPRPLTCAQQGLDFWLLVLRLDGHADLDVNGESVRFEGKRLELRRLDQANCGTVSAHRSVLVFLPRAELVGMESMLDQMAMSAAHLAELHPLLAHYLKATVDLLPNASAQEVARMAEMTVSMIRACVTARKVRQSAEASLMTMRLETAKRLVAGSLGTDTLTQEGLCAEMNVSRRQLYKIFEPVGGVDRYIRSSRLKACHDKILGENRSRSISSIAEEFGFEEIASFSRQFRAQFGFSPSELRAQVAERTETSRFVQWLAGDNGSPDAPSPEYCQAV